MGDMSTGLRRETVDYSRIDCDSNMLHGVGSTWPIDTIVNEFFEYKQSHLRVITELLAAVLWVWWG